MISIAICDDDKYITSMMEDMILRSFGNKSNAVNIDVFFSGKAMLGALNDGAFYDLMFLDIELTDLKGYMVGEYLRNELQNYDTEIVYVTGKEGYERKLFDSQPLKFLEKPFEKREIEECFDLLEKKRGKCRKRFTYLKGKNEYYNVALNEIIYFESAGRRIKIVTKDSEDFFYGKISDLAERIDSSEFIHVHRAYIVNYEQVIRINAKSVEMSNGEEIPLGREGVKKICAKVIV